MKTYKRYKVVMIDKGFVGPIVEEYKYSLPKKGKPGEWHSVEPPLMMCWNGFHVYRKQGIAHGVSWLISGNERGAIFECQVAGESIINEEDDENKECWQHMRLVRRITGAERKRLLELR